MSQTPSRDAASSWIDNIRQDLRYAVRGFAHHTGFTATVVFTLALGIGANATMFGILDRLLLRAPAHVADPDQVVQVHTRWLGRSGVQSSQPYAVAADLAAAVPEFASVGAATPVRNSSPYPLGRGVDGTRVIGVQVSPGFFTTMGVRPALGRFFHDDEAGEINPQRLAVIGYGFWQRHFAGSSSVIGSTLDIGTDQYTVVGVAPKGFTGAEPGEVEVWIPIAAADGLRFIKGPEWRTSGAQWLNVYARLQPGVSPAQAVARATAAFRAGERGRRTGASLARVDSMEVVLGSIIPGRALGSWGLTASSGEMRVARLLGIVSLLVLLLACANVANLLLVRSLNRGRETAVRLALGISRGRLVRQHLLEGVLLAGLGAVAALVVVPVGSRFISSLLTGAGPLAGSAVDGRVVAFTAIAAVLTGILASLLPAIQSSNPRLATALKSGVREGTVSRSFTRSVLLGTQAALALLLLTGAGLFVRSLQRVADLPLGIDVDRVLVADIEHSSAGLSNAQALDLYLEFAERARTLPGITASAVSIAHSFGLGWGTRVYFRGEALSLPQQGFSQYAITPDYFTVMGIRLLSGRAFNENDRGATAPVAIINQTAARAFWPAGDAIGSCVQVGGDTMPCTTIVGIVSDARRQQLVEGPVPQIYRPLLQLPEAAYGSTVSVFGYTLLARAQSSPSALVEPLRRLLQATSPVVPYAHVRPLSENVGQHTRSWRLGASIFSLFGVLALVLAAVGLYSVVVFTMAQRVHEYGVRLALGATSGHLVGLAMSRGLLPVAFGVVIGLMLALAAGGVMSGLLFETNARDPVVLGLVVVLLTAVATIASFIPGLRAARTDPLEALRSN